MIHRQITHHLLSFWISFRQQISQFWDRFPLLAFSLLFLSGIGAYLTPAGACGIFLSTRKRWRIASLAFALGFLYTSWLYPTFYFQKLKGNASIHIDKIAKYTTPVSQGLVYEVTIKTFATSRGIFRNLPSRIYLRSSTDRPLANTNYFFSQVTLEQPFPFFFVLQPPSEDQWIPLHSSFSFAEWRYRIKKKMSSLCYRQFPKKQVGNLVATLLTGELDDLLLKHAFRRIGLQHLLVISGFHFALLSSLLFCLFRLFFSQKVGSILVLAFIGGYAFYLGPAPSISRAWIIVCLFLIARLASYRFSTLNALGAALFLALVDSPMIATRLGFQLSFLATFAILTLYEPLEKQLFFLLPKRSMQAALSLSLAGQVGYLLTTYLRKGLSLTGAVTCLTLPLLLFHFSSIPLLGWIYNLFFPFLFTPALLLSLLTPLAPFLTPITAWYGDFLLTLVFYAPRKMELFLYFPYLTKTSTLLLLCPLLFLAIYLATPRFSAPLKERTMPK